MAFDADNIFAFYEMEEVGATARLDSVGTYDATAFGGPPNIPGVDGNACFYPSGNTTVYLEIPTGIGSPFVRDHSTTSFSFWMWAESATNFTSTQYLISRMNLSTPDYFIECVAPNSIAFYIDDGAGGSAQSSTTVSGHYVAGEPNLVLWTWDHIAGVLTGYVVNDTNGTASNTLSYNAQVPNSAPTDPVRLGRYIFTGSYWGRFSGDSWIDSVAFYEGALTSDDVDTIWASQGSLSALQGGGGAVRNNSLTLSTGIRI